MLTEHGCDFVLQSTLGLSDASLLRDNLLLVITAGDDLYLDASGVERVSTPCIQVLYAAALEVEAAGGRFHIVSPSQIVADAFHDLGMAIPFKRWSSE
jgi:chemotaxis protein CheX